MDPRRVGPVIEHERKTGMIANMKLLGWHLAERHYKTGLPKVFRMVDPRDPGAAWFHLQWMVKKQEWRIQRMYCRPGACFPTSKIIGPMFPGPVAAASWLQLEIANGLQN